MKGETQEEIFEELLSMLPQLTSAHDKIILIFYRGYGKISFVEENSKRNFDISMIANTVGSRNPSISISASTAYIHKCRIKKKPLYP